jgi:hypothetical protein
MQCTHFSDLHFHRRILLPKFLAVPRRGEGKAPRPVSVGPIRFISSRDCAALASVAARPMRAAVPALARFPQRRDFATSIACRVAQLGKDGLKMG